MPLSPAERYTCCRRALLRRLSAVIPLACFALAFSGNGAETGSEYTNRLIDSNNPYLLLHAHNPVDWYPWGPEALAKAKRENKPIFLSIGYSTCYWCHVAERTLFSNPEIAKLMNEWFVSIKVDREERPDLDAVYMLATQLLTSGAGGWPNNLFLTPDLKPFYAGGYFPPEDDETGRPGFPSVLKAMHEEWTNNAERAKKRGDGVVEVLRQYQASATMHTRAAIEPKQWLASTREAILKRFDAEHGGVGNARQSTKFPRSPSLDLMLTDYQRSRNPDTLRFLTVTLDAMAYGGVYDQLDGGFHRYSTERTWSIPHFEKMLYDNAQLLGVYTRAWQLTGKPQYKRIALGVRDYLRRQMTSPEGGFYTAEDAAVDGEEGASYLWTQAEIETVLGRDTGRFLDVYTLTPMPTEASALDPETLRGVVRVHRSGAGDADPVERQLAMLDAQRHKLLHARDARPQPARDEKLLVGLNGLAIEGFAISGAGFHDREDVAVARRAAERIWKLAWNNQTGRLSHQIFMGHAQGEGFLDDYALLGRGFLALHRASGDEVWLQRARTLADALLRRFDPDNDGILASAADTEILIVAPMEQGDEAYPSGTSAAVDLLAKLSKATGSKPYAEAAARIARQVPGRPEQWPTLVAAVNTTDLSTSASAARSDAAPAPAGQTAAHLRVSGATRSSAGYDEIVVTLEIERGFHINANPASFDFLIPTTVTLAGIHPVEVRYPPPTPLRSSFAPDTLNVYKGSVQAVARLKKGSLDGLQSLKATVSAQACTETVCLPPSQIPLIVHLK